MHKRVLVLLALLLLACTAGVVSAAVPTSGLISDKSAAGGDTVHASRTVTIYLGQSYSFYWTWYRNGVPARYYYYTLQSSINGGSWVTRDSDYTNGNGRTYTYTIRPTATGTYKYRSVMSGVSSEVVTVYVVKSTPKASFYASPTSGYKNNTNFKFVGSASGGTPYKWYWTFGDGKSAYGQTVYHRYSYSGYKTVTLKVYFTNGWWASQTRYSYIRVY